MCVDIRQWGVLRHETNDKWGNSNTLKSGWWDREAKRYRLNDRRFWCFVENFSLKAKVRMMEGTVATVLGHRWWMLRKGEEWKCTYGECFESKDHAAVSEKKQKVSKTKRLLEQMKKKSTLSNTWIKNRGWMRENSPK